MRFALSGQPAFLALSRDDGLDLLEWIGLGRAEFGAVEVSVLLPLCRRRMWPVARNVDPARRGGDGLARAAGAALKRLTSELAAAIARMPETLVRRGGTGLWARSSAYTRTCLPISLYRRSNLSPAVA